MGRTLYLPVILALSCLVYDVSGSVPRVDPLVETNVGLIRGLTASDGDYSMFLGIPYATVDPANPFGPSIPHEGFEGTFNAYDDSAICPQQGGLTNSLPIGTLDCLHLNIHVPYTANSRNRVPVLVWIHGGAFTSGFSGRTLFGPKFLIRHDVIVVTINYRLGAYGFLCLDTPEVPGNQGLKDQLTALRWIKNNIEAFGGDSSKITLVGESAGAASVDFHLIYSQQNLFNNVIIQSGTTLSNFAVTESDPSAAIRLAERLGHLTDNLNEALAFLSTVNSDLVIAASSEIGITTVPCVEQEFENVERYVTGHPTEVNIPNAGTKPIMIGFNNNEFGVNFLDSGSGDPFALLEGNLDYDSVTIENVVNNVRQFYIGDNDLNDEMDEQVGNFRSDFTFLHPTYRSIQKYFENGASSVYHYMFSYDGERNYLKIIYNATATGALHADELGYLFDTVDIHETPTPQDQLIIDRMTSLWTNFVKYSNPIPEITDTLPVEWPVVTSEAMHCLNIDSELSVQRRPFHERMAFWDLFYKLDEVLSGANQEAVPYQD